MERLVPITCCSIVVTAMLILHPTALRASDKKSSDKQAIETPEEEFSDAFNAKNVDAIMKVYAPG